MTYFRKPQPHHTMIQRLLTLTLGGYVISVFACVMWSGLVTPRPIFCASAQEPLIAEGEVGRYGGRLVVAERTEPRTLNPITAVDLASRDIIRRLNADLIHINCHTQQTEPALASCHTASSFVGSMSGGRPRRRSYQPRAAS